MTKKENIADPGICCNKDSDASKMAEMENLPEVAIDAMESLFTLWECLSNGLTMGHLVNAIRLAVTPESAEMVFLNMALVNMALDRALSKEEDDDDEG